MVGEAFWPFLSFRPSLPGWAGSSGPSLPFGPVFDGGRGVLALPFLSAPSSRVGREFWPFPSFRPRLRWWAEVFWPFPSFRPRLRGWAGCSGPSLPFGPVFEGGPGVLALPLPFGPVFEGRADDAILQDKTPTFGLTSELGALHRYIWNSQLYRSGIGHSWRHSDFLLWVATGSYQEWRSDSFTFGVDVKEVKKAKYYDIISKFALLICYSGLYSFKRLGRAFVFGDCEVGQHNALSRGGVGLEATNC